MKKFKKILFLALMIATLSCLFCQPAFAISEEEVQAQVDAVGKETVSGNVLIWFMCAIGFLKVSQKIDSFMASLGVNVGHTGGSMLAEAMIAAKGIGGFKNFSSHHFGGGRSSSSTHVNANGSGGKGGAAGFGAGFASGGLAGVIKRNVTNNAVKTATTPSDAKPSGLGGLVGGAAGGVGGHIYSSSVSKGGDFANHVVGSVATGNITQMGTITGEKAVEALHSYMGHTALGPGAENMQLEQGYDTLAGDAGDRLSGGERQRITIARAMLKPSSVVILDEATAYADPENEALIQQAISKLVAGKTLIVVAHRLNTIRNADQILVVANGNIAGRGTQEELLRECPIYQKMWQDYAGTIEEADMKGGVENHA